MREIEIKLRVKDLSEIKKKLEASGCVLSEPISQHDVIYSLGGSNKEFQGLKKGDIVIRIRYLKDKAIFTLKKQQTGELDSLEYETVVGDPKQMDQALQALGYQPAVEVKKVRQKGKLGEYEVCLDQVESLGSFIELEKLTVDDADPELVTNELFSVLESYGLSRKDSEGRGYDTQIYQLNH